MQPQFDGIPSVPDMALQQKAAAAAAASSPVGGCKHSELTTSPFQLADRTHHACMSRQEGRLQALADMETMLQGSSAAAVSPAAVKDAWPLTVHFLSDRNADIRQGAARLLGKMGAHAARPQPDQPGPCTSDSGSHSCARE